MAYLSKDTILVTFALLSTVLFILYDRRVKSYSGRTVPYKTSSIAQFLSLVIWIGVLVIEFGNFTWWKAILSLGITFLLVNVIARIISRFFRDKQLFIVSITAMVVAIILILINIIF